jgi:nucleotide-binding universal stress UspA family protein
MVYDHVLVPLKGTEPIELLLPNIEAMTHSGLVRKVTFLCIAGAAYPQDVLVSPTCNNIIMNPKARDEAILRHTSEAKAYLSKLVSELNIYGVNIFGEVLPPGIVVYTIVKYVLNNRVDLIIMASHARSGIRRWMFSNKSEQILKLVNIPVMIIRLPTS